MGQPPADMPDMERLAWYQATRASEEERAVVEDLVRRQEAGERLKPNEEVKIASKDEPHDPLNGPHDQ